MKSRKQEKQLLKEYFIESDSESILSESSYLVIKVACMNMMFLAPAFIKKATGPAFLDQIQPFFICTSWISFRHKHSTPKKPDLSPYSAHSRSIHKYLLCHTKYSAPYLSLFSMQEPLIHIHFLKVYQIPPDHLY